MNWILTHVLFLGVPITSIVAWAVMYKSNTSDDNYIRAWNVTFPLSGVFFMVFYIFMFKDFVDLFIREEEFYDTWGTYW